MSPPSVASQAATGLPLTYFSHFNASWFRPQRFAMIVGEVNMSRLSRCSESVNSAYPLLGQEYYDATGDKDGVELQDGRNILKCWEEKWWVAPSCRGNISDCLAVVTGGSGWGMYELPQQAFFHNMPLAFATAAAKQYVPLNRDLQSLLYWWTPDASFIDFDPERVLFPTHDAQEFRRGIYRSMPSDVVLTNWAAGGLDSEMAQDAEGPLALASNMQLFNSDMVGLLKENQKLDIADGEMRAWETACNWLKTNRNRNFWHQWVPRETDCARGQGLVDALGAFVTNVSQALKCATCPSGYAALQHNGQRICSPCPAGFFQNFPGESSCLPCEPGSIAMEEGSRECQPCRLGEFANGSAMTSCYRCGQGDHRDRWTTSQLVVSQGDLEKWIQVQGATSQDFCACEAGSFLFQSSCMTCMEGSSCPGSNSLELLPGYFSTAEEPGEVFQCFGNSKRCPGGLPGTCAFQRDPTSVTCSKCIDGTHAEANGTCVSCSGRHVAIFLTVTSMAMLSLLGLYLILLKMKLRHPTSLLIVSISLSQMIFIAQKLTVLFRFKIEWEEPFLNVLRVLELLAFDLKIISIDCISPLNSTIEFSARVMVVPMFCIVVFLVHILHACLHRTHFFSKIQLAQLTSTVGTVFSICFIPVFSSLLAPFQCQEHPNRKFTLQDYHGVFCNFTEEHLQMCIIGAVACLLPIGFLALCTWVVLVEVPRRQSRSDLSFLRAWSFLFIRFRPGTQVFSVLFLVRNALVVLCQLLSNESAKVVLLNLMLYISLILTAYKKPWRFMVCNWLDILLLTGLMAIVDMGAVTMRDRPQTAMIICICFLSCMMAAILAAVVFGAWKYARQKYRKRFNFFITHQKSAAGCFARLLKMELVAAGKTVFIDSDDLVDVSCLCRYVSQDTQKLLILATPEIVKRRFCLAEMATAQLCEVPSIVLTWPKFQVPDENFIKNLSQEVEILNELAKFGIFRADIEGTLWWLQILESIKIPTELTREELGRIVGKLTNTVPKISGFASGETELPVLADPENLEAVSAALILLKCLQPQLSLDDVMPKLLCDDMKVTRARTAVLIITKGCFGSPRFAHWLLQVHSQQCSIVPVITEENHDSPSKEELHIAIAPLQIDAVLYLHVVQAVFRELSVRFVPASFSNSQQDLELHAKKVHSRLTFQGMNLAQLVSLEVKDDDDDYDASSVATEKT
ncbi:unnamed protein product [Cladocopium goreaui]|nr:unnamed protein product [Cladocopium goreaui]